MDNISNNKIDCFEYEFSIMDLIIPQYYIFLKFCLPHTKTKIFITSFLRIILWTVLFFVLKNYDIINYCGNNIKIFGYQFLLVMIIINIVYLILIIFKIPSLTKNKINKSSKTIYDFLENNKISYPVEQTSIDVTITPTNISVPIKSNYKFN